MNGLVELSVGSHKIPAPPVKVTMPVGVAAPGALTATVAVKVTLWPTTGFASSTVRLVVLAACVIGTVRSGEVE